MPKPQIIRTGPQFEAAFWAQFQAAGPRHRNVYRRLHVNGWSIDRDACVAYLAPEVSEARH